MNGGVGNASKRIVKYFKKLGVEVHVFTLDGRKDNHLATSKKELLSSLEDGILIHRYGPYSGTFTDCPAKELHNMLFFLEKLHQRYDFDLFHGFRVYACGFMAALMAKKNGKKAITSARGVDLDEDVFRPELFSSIKWTLDNSDIVTFVSEESRQNARLIFGDPKNKFKTIHNSIDPSVYRSLKPNSWLRGFVIGYPGLIRRKKGFSYLLEAFEKFCKETETTLLVIGDFLEDESETYHRTLVQSSIKNKIKITGLVPNKHILNYLQLADVVVQPSISEGCPNTFIEAMYAGKPVIGSRVGAIPEVINHRQNGLLVEPHSSEQLYNAIKQIHDDQNFAKYLGNNASASIRSKFMPINETRQWSDILYRLNFENKPISPRVFIRNDDVMDLTDNLKEFINFFLEQNIPVNYMIVPGRITQRCIEHFLQLKQSYPSLIHLNQHGYMHKNHNTSSDKGEFGKFRTYQQQYTDIKKGFELMQAHFGENFSAVFTPPNHVFNEDTLKILEEFKFKAFSNKLTPEKNRIYPFYAFYEAPVTVDLLEKGEIGLTPKPKDRLIEETNESLRQNTNTGILFHHEYLKDYTLIKELVYYLKGENVEFLSIEEICKNEEKRNH